MEKFPRLSSEQVIKILAKIGFLPTRQRGSHVILIKMIEVKNLLSFTVIEKIIQEKLI